MIGWRPQSTAPELEAVLTCRYGDAKSVRQMYRGDGSRKHPACWICEITREPVSEFEQPDLWAPMEVLPAIPLTPINSEETG